MSNPVHLTTQDVGKTKNYGTGFAPYFLPLALWVGSLIGYLFLDPLPKTKKRNKSLRVSAARTVVGYTPMALLALLQSFILCFVVERGLGLAPVRTFWFYATVIIAALVYVAILQWLNASFGPIGKFLAIILLMLQLTSAGGTFPIELQSRFFQVLHPLMPMSYIVGALRNAIAGGPVINIIHNLIPLVCFGLAAFILTIIAAGTKLSDTAAKLSERVGL
jgi:putative membrane protein